MKGLTQLKKERLRESHVRSWNELFGPRHNKLLQTQPSRNVGIYAEEFICKLYYTAEEDVMHIILNSKLWYL